MKKVLLISAEFVRAHASISNEMQDKFLKPSIQEAQDIHLEQVLGTKLVNKLCELVRTGAIGEVENTKYKELLDRSQFFLMYQTLAIMTVTASVKFSNAGLYTTNDENMTQIPLDDVFKMQSMFQNKSDYYKDRLQDYCKENYKKFPELKSCGLYDVKPVLDSAASCPIFLGGARGRKVRR